VGRCGDIGKLRAVAAARFDPYVEAALLSAYGVDVLDPATTPRRILTLLRLLPAGTWPDYSDTANAAVWSTEAHLLASVIDALQWNTWTLARVNSRRKPKEPTPVKRPGAKARRTADRTTKRSSLAALAREIEAGRG
jgi:hypothetical protein